MTFLEWWVDLEDTLAEESLLLACLVIAMAINFYALVVSWNTWSVAIPAVLLAVMIPLFIDAMRVRCRKTPDENFLNRTSR